MTVWVRLSRRWEGQIVKTCYVDVVTRSIADLVQPGEMAPFWVITRINVPREHRGQGLGSKMLKEICADADKEGCSLGLDVSPSDGLDYDQLVAWYKRYGFKSSQHGYYMVRRPQ
jgi:ribosomal protein S18 acetylase RimI-like enzyme